MSESGPQSQIENLARQYTGGSVNPDQVPQEEPPKSSFLGWILFVLFVGIVVIGVRIFLPEIWLQATEKVGGILKKIPRDGIVFIYE